MANETRKEQENLYGSALYWQKELDAASNYERDWRERGNIIIDRYRDEREGYSITGFYGLIPKLLKPHFLQKWLNLMSGAGSMILILLGVMLLFYLNVRFNTSPTQTAQICQ